MKFLHITQCSATFLAVLFVGGCAAQRHPPVVSPTHFQADLAAQRAAQLCPPRVELTSRNWLGSEQSEFVLYEDGRVIYWNDKLSRFASVVLDPAEMLSVIAAVEPAARAEPESRFGKPGLVFHQMSGVLALRLPSDSGCHVLAVDARAGNAIAAARAYLMAFEHNDAEEWIPDTVEIRLTPLQGGDIWREMPWPSHWPQLRGALPAADGTRILKVTRAQYQQMRLGLENRQPRHLPYFERRFWMIETLFPLPH